MNELRSQIRDIAGIGGHRTEVWICLDDLLAQINAQYVAGDKRVVGVFRILTEVRQQIIGLGDKK